MTDKEKIRAEIVRLKNNVGSALLGYDMGEENGAFLAYEKVLAFINSLPEEPASKDLEEEIERFSDYSNLLAPQEEVEIIARHFANWQKERLINKACKWLSNFYSEDRHCYLVDKDIDNFKKAMEEKK